MRCKIDNDIVIIRSGIVTKKIDVKRITRIVYGKRIKFFNGNLKLYSHRFSQELSDLCNLLYKEYYCEEIEYSDPAFQKWRKISNPQLEAEVEAKRKTIDNILHEYKDKFDFDLCSDVVINYELRSVAFNFWGEKSGKKALIYTGRNTIELYIFIPFICPLKLYKNVDKSTLVIYDELDALLKEKLDDIIKMLEYEGWGIAVKQEKEKQ